MAIRRPTVWLVEGSGGEDCGHWEEEEEEEEEIFWSKRVGERALVEESVRCLPV